MKAILKGAGGSLINVPGCESKCWVEQAVPPNYACQPDDIHPPAIAIRQSLKRTDLGALQRASEQASGVRIR